MSTKPPENSNLSSNNAFLLFVKSPSRVSLVGVGMIINIGSVVATGLLFSRLGFTSFSCLSGVFLGLPLTIYGALPGKTSNVNKDSSITNDPKIIIAPTKPKPVINTKDIVTIGSPGARLTEDEIHTELNDLNVETLAGKYLVIYANKDVKFNTDPGFARLSPQKVILFGAVIDHEPKMFGSQRGLDNLLHDQKIWLSGDRTFKMGQKIKRTPTHVKQMEVSSVEDALNHETPLIPNSTEHYHAVYLVNES